MFVHYVSYKESLNKYFVTAKIQRTYGNKSFITGKQLYRPQKCVSDITLVSWTELMKK